MQQRDPTFDVIARGFGSRGRSDPNLLSTASSFQADPGPNVVPGELGGYHLDFRFKAREPGFPPHWLKPREQQLHVATAQWGLGCFERHLCGEGAEWLTSAIDCARHLVDHQHEGGRFDGGWWHETAMPHTYSIPTPWLSAMAQGEAASLLVRVHRETGEEGFAQSALRALGVLDIPVSEGGVRAELGGGPFYEEYPTIPASYVLNGGIFAIWGAYDVAVALGDAASRERFERSAETLVSNLHRWDLGSWSRYDLFPHPVANVASAAYHMLHISQLQAMQRIYERDETGAILERWEAYPRSRVKTSTAFARKVAFRLLVPRNRLLAHRLPWSHRAAAGGRRE